MRISQAQSGNNFPRDRRQSSASVVHYACDAARHRYSAGMNLPLGSRVIIDSI
jgi:hypothetical protein